jgi:two-component system NtrC family sensor kinase
MIRFLAGIFRRNLGIRLTLSVATIMVLAIGPFIYLSMKAHEGQLLHGLTKEANRFSEAIKGSLWHSMLVEGEADEFQLLPLTVASKEQKELKGLRIYDGDGRIVFSTDRSEIGMIVDRQAPACVACHTSKTPQNRLEDQQQTVILKTEEEHRFLSVTNPIYNESGCYQATCHAHPEEKKVLGILSFEMSLADVDAFLTKNRRNNALLAVATLLLVSTVIGLFIQRFVHRPVKQLVDQTKYIAEGVLDEAVPITTRDEMGYLAKSFNKMTVKLKEAREQAQEREQALEQKVIELRQIQDHLIRSEKLASLGKMAAGVAHEINNPLAAILAYCYYLLRKLRNEKPVRDRLEVMIKETTRCSRIVRNLLDFAGEVHPELKPVNINEILNQTLFLLESQVLFHNTEIRKNLECSLPLVMLDSGQIQQVFINIILNAAEACGDEGHLSITTRAKDNFVEVEFQDNGCGIPKEDLGKIFDPFYSRKGDREGTGLGLAVSYGIVERHYGRIEVESKVGKGSTFTIKFPLSES